MDVGQYGCSSGAAGLALQRLETDSGEVIGAGPACARGSVAGAEDAGGDSGRYGAGSGCVRVQVGDGGRDGRCGDGRRPVDWGGQTGRRGWVLGERARQGGDVGGGGGEGPARFSTAFCASWAAAAAAAARRCAPRSSSGRWSGRCGRAGVDERRVHRLGVFAIKKPGLAKGLNHDDDDDDDDDGPQRVQPVAVPHLAHAVPQRNDRRPAVDGERPSRRWLIPLPRRVAQCQRSGRCDGRHRHLSLGRLRSGLLPSPDAHRAHPQRYVALCVVSWFCSPTSTCRPHRRPQVELHLRMVDVRTQESPADIPVCAHLTHTLAHGRKTVHLFPSRCGHPFLSSYSLSSPVFAECDKSFTRSDALAKHMRLQHNIEPPLPGRGGHRKRKREDAEPDAASGPTLSSFNTFKVEPHTPGSEVDDLSVTTEQKGDYFNHANHPPANGVAPQRSNSPVGNADADYRDDPEDGLPPHLLQAMDPQTGLILGRSPDMVRYLLMKAKHKYALEQHEHLIEELRIARYELKRVRADKDAALDELLRVNFGCVDLIISSMCFPAKVLS